MQNSSIYYQYDFFIIQPTASYKRKHRDVIASEAKQSSLRPSGLLRADAIILFSARLSD